MKTVLITGVGGFIGGYLLREFKAHNWKIIGLDVNDNHLAECDQFYKFNVLTDDISQIFKENPAIDVCLHTAGRASVPLSMQDPFGDFQSNTISTYRLLETIRQHSSIDQRPRIVLLSSAAVYGTPSQLPISESCPINPLSYYGYNKYLAEECCRSYAKLSGISVDILRIFSAYGEGLQRQVIWDICRKAYYDPQVKLLGTGNESRDFIHGEDIARACMFLVNSVNPGFNVLNLGCGEETTVYNLAKMIINRIAPGKSLIFDQQEQKGNPTRWQADISTLNSLGYLPAINLECGIERVTDWFKKISA